MIPLTAALHLGDAGASAPLVDWLGWAGEDAEVRRWLRAAHRPDGTFSASLHPGARDWTGALRDPTVYAAEVRLEDLGELSVLRIREAVVFTNPTDRPLELLRLRVFAGVVDPRWPVRIEGVWTGGRPAPHLLDDSILTVRLPRPLRPGDSARILLQLVEPVLAFAPEEPQRGPGWSPARGGVLGEADDQVALGLMLPTVTAFGADGQDTRPVGWNALPSVYDPASWHVTFVHPARFTLASTGVEVARSADDRLVTAQVVAGGVRDFAAHLVPDARVSTVAIGGTTLRTVWRGGEGSDGVGEDLQRIGEAALRAGVERYGALRAAEVDVVEGPLRGATALDFPELVVIDTRHARRPYHRSARHEWALAHALAHQWWRHESGSDGVAEPWLDEGLADHAASRYWEARYGRQAAVDRHDVEVLEPVGAMVAEGVNLLPGTLPADGYDLPRFSALVAGRGALFFDGLRRAFGDDEWDAALRALRAAGSGERLSGDAALAILARWAPEGVDVRARFAEQMVSPDWLADLATPP
jgi:hypothetical protein